MGKLDGKSAIISGGCGGIGSQAARLFSREGAIVTIADLNQEQGFPLCEEITRDGGNAGFAKADITSASDVAGAIEIAEGRTAKLDVVYNCSGGSSFADGIIENVSDEEFWRTIRVDLFGTWLICKQGIPRLIKAGGGSVINMSSAAAVRGQTGVNAYSAAQGGVSALTRALAFNYSRHNIRVNAIAPGAVATARVKAMLIA